MQKLLPLLMVSCFALGSCKNVRLGAAGADAGGAAHIRSNQACCAVLPPSKNSRPASGASQAGSRRTRPWLPGSWWRQTS